MCVWRTEPTYFAHLLSSPGFIEARPTLQRAMSQAGILETARAAAVEMKLVKAQQVVDERLAGAHETLHPEVRKLKDIQVEEAHQLVADDARGDVATPPVTRPRRGRKPRQSKGSCGSRCLQHCWICGDAAHKTQTCPQAPEEMRLKAHERQLVAAQLAAHKRKAAIVTHLKYVNVAQRTQLYEERHRERRRVRPATTLKELLRMPALRLVQACIESKLITDLRGALCTMLACLLQWFREGRQRPCIGKALCVAEERSGGRRLDVDGGLQVCELSRLVLGHLCQQLVQQSGWEESEFRRQRRSILVLRAQHPCHGLLPRPRIGR